MIVKTPQRKASSMSDKTGIYANAMDIKFDEIVDFYQTGDFAEVFDDRLADGGRGPDRATAAGELSLRQIVVHRL